MIGMLGRDTLTLKFHKSHNICDTVSNHISPNESISILKLGGVGKSGKLGKSILIVVKLNLGSLISVHTFIFEKSRYMLGIFIGGIGRAGSNPSGQINHNLHVNWS